MANHPAISAPCCPPLLSPVPGCAHRRPLSALARLKRRLPRPGCHVSSPSSRHSRGGRCRQVTAAAPASRVTVLPAGRKQARVQLPACLLVVSAAEVVQRREQVAAAIGEAVGQGATGVLLTDEQSTGGMLPHASLLIGRLLCAAADVHGAVFRASSGQAWVHACACDSLCMS